MGKVLLLGRHNVYLSDVISKPNIFLSKWTVSYKESGGGLKGTNHKSLFMSCDGKLYLQLSVYIWMKTLLSWLSASGFSKLSKWIDLLCQNVGRWRLRFLPFMMMVTKLWRLRISSFGKHFGNVGITFTRGWRHHFIEFP